MKASGKRFADKTKSSLISHVAYGGSSSRSISTKVFDMKKHYSLPIYVDQSSQ